MSCNECNECVECQEGNTWTVSITWECWCGTCNDCCEKKECCVPNIVWGNCIDVTEDWNGVITISTECNPEVISSDGTVTVTKTHDNIDVWDLSVADSDYKVWACANDKNPSTLNEKLVWVDGITITPICSDNGKVQIGFDHSTINCDDKKVAVTEWCTPQYLANAISINSNYIQGRANGCTYTITDKVAPMYYAKMYLSTTITESIPKGSVQWYILNNKSYWVDYVQWLEVSNWMIRITKKWLYNVWFTWSLECWYWVHWIRVQLYASNGSGSNYRTIVESRYSAPVWLQPYEVWAIWTYEPIDTNTTWNNSTYTNNTVTTKYPIRIDNPIITEKTDVQWVSWKSASLWAYISRMPVGWYTIMELNVWDVILLWAKLQTEIDYDWDILGKYPCSAWTFSLLARNDNDVNSWWECGLSISAHLVYPLV